MNRLLLVAALLAAHVSARCLDHNPDNVCPEQACNPKLGPVVCKQGVCVCKPGYCVDKKGVCKGCTKFRVWDTLEQAQTEGIYTLMEGVFSGERPVWKQENGGHMIYYCASKQWWVLSDKHFDDNANCTATFASYKTAADTVNAVARSMIWDDRFTMWTGDKWVHPFPGVSLLRMECEDGNAVAQDSEDTTPIMPTKEEEDRCVEAIQAFNKKISTAINKLSGASPKGMLLGVGGFLQAIVMGLPDVVNKCRAVIMGGRGKKDNNEDRNPFKDLDLDTMFIALHQVVPDSPEAVEDRAFAQRVILAAQQLLADGATAFANWEDIGSAVQQAKSLTDLTHKQNSDLLLGLVTGAIEAAGFESLTGLWAKVRLSSQFCDTSGMYGASSEVDTAIAAVLTLSAPQIAVGLSVLADTLTDRLATISDCLQLNESNLLAPESQRQVKQAMTRLTAGLKTIQQQETVKYTPGALTVSGHDVYGAINSVITAWLDKQHEACGRALGRMLVKIGQARDAQVVRA